MSDYLPKTDSDLLVWFNNFRSKFPTYGPTMGFTGFEVSAVGDDYNMLVFVTNAAEAVRNESTARTRYRACSAMDQSARSSRRSRRFHLCRCRRLSSCQNCSASASNGSARQGAPELH